MRAIKDPLKYDNFRLVINALQDHALVSKYLELQAGERNIDKLREQHDDILNVLVCEYPDLEKEEISMYLAMYSGLAHLEYREREKILLKHSKRADTRNKYHVASYLASKSFNSAAKVTVLAECILDQAVTDASSSGGRFSNDAINKIERAANILDRVSNPAKIAALANIQEKQIEASEEAPKFHMNLIEMHKPLIENKKKVITKIGKK